MALEKRRLGASGNSAAFSAGASLAWFHYVSLHVFVHTSSCMLSILKGHPTYVEGAGAASAS